MIELRWLEQDGQRTLQMRQQYDAKVYAGMGHDKSSPEMRWSDWRDVPTHVIPSQKTIVITAEAVQHLRDKTDMPMMECKKALVACEGDMSKAMDWLRTPRMDKIF